MSTPEFSIKLSVFGDFRVGRTSLILRFVNDTFSDIVYAPTPEFYLKDIELDRQKVRLQIWENNANERFPRVISTIVRSAMGLILVYDISSRESFDRR